MSEIRFYLDESVQLAVAEQLSLSEIDVVSVHSLDKLSDSDANHLQRAGEMHRVLVSYDQDFLRLAQEFTEHYGIAFGHNETATIGGCVKALKMLHGKYTAEDVQGHVIFLSFR